MKTRLLILLPLLLSLSSCSLFKKDESSSKNSAYTIMCNNVTNHYTGGLTFAAQAQSSKVIFDTINMEVVSNGFASLSSGGVFRTQDKQGSYMFNCLQDIVMVFNGTNTEDTENYLVMSLVGSKNSYSFTYGGDGGNNSPYISKYKNDETGMYTLYFSNYALKDTFSKFSLEFTGGMNESVLVESIAFTYGY